MDCPYITDCLSAGSIRLELKATDRDGAIRELLYQIRDDLTEYSAEDLLTAVLERENKMPTGVGKGVALPHALIPGLNRVYVAVGFSRAGIDFQSPDGEPATMAVLMLFPEEAHERRIRLLAQLSRLLRVEDLRIDLGSAASPGDVVSILKTAERGLDENRA